MSIFPIQRFTVHGNSMLPILKPGQDVLVFKWAYWWSQPKVGDIVAIKVNSKAMIKRIQKVDGRTCFVIGDNEKESTDSRKFGPIDKSQIIGQVVCY